MRPDGILVPRNLLKAGQVVVVGTKPLCLFPSQPRLIGRFIRENKGYQIT
jgi:hypothetical protein